MRSKATPATPENSVWQQLAVPAGARGSATRGSAAGKCGDDACGADSHDARVRRRSRRYRYCLRRSTARLAGSRRLLVVAAARSLRSGCAPGAIAGDCGDIASGGGNLANALVRVQSEIYPFPALSKAIPLNVGEVRAGCRATVSAAGGRTGAVGARSGDRGNDARPRPTLRIR